MVRDLGKAVGPGWGGSGWWCKWAGCGGSFFAYSPVLLFTSNPILTPSSIKSTTLRKSSSRNCREVRAGAPRRATAEKISIAKPLGQPQCRRPSLLEPQVSPSRRPPGVMALRSPGQVFLLAVMDTSSRTRSARAPSKPLGRRSTSTKWLSVPPKEGYNQVMVTPGPLLGGYKGPHPPAGSPDTSE